MFRFQSKTRAAEKAAMAELRSLVAAFHRSQAVIEFDLDGSVRDANANFLEALGYDLSDIQGRHHSMFVDSAEAASPAYADFWRRLNAGEFFVDKFVRYGKGGRRVVIEASYNPMLGADGRPYKVVKFATDVTAIEDERSRRAEAERQAAEIQTAVVDGTRRGLSAMAAGDLSYRIAEVFPGDYASLRDDFNQAMAALDGAVGVIRGNAGAIQSGANEISSAAEDLSSRTERQAAALEETAAALDQITATVQKTAEHAKATDAVVAATRVQAETGGAVVQRAIAAMGEIERSSDQISDIVSVIDEIAFQTNLLALNAGVEAARAGDAGRGFAVVASEVRALAQRSADSARQIKTLISTSGAQVKSGVGLVHQSGEALSGIAEGVREVTTLMTEIRASTQEQAIGLAEVNTAVNAMDQVTQQNAAMVEESTAASLALTQDAAQMTQLVGRFQVSPQEGEQSIASAAQRDRNGGSVGRSSPTAQEVRRPRLAAVGGGRVAQADWQEF
ncbi:MAG: methyl-accepting chemotaxis protein [Brevundimonas sp.]|uniref:methyl-accepting chemotaxis protein n=1 Tax=Brevundimonas sp. TaxID=1871086 RepID=UPI00271E8BAA|nr:methyl-accepting chemotaxis protein [Brevundimonas sp.]MDO9609368.1 methyl-accepting chemotaxis protein [Brevundimonas sp.]